VERRGDILLREGAIKRRAAGVEGIGEVNHIGMERRRYEGMKTGAKGLKGGGEDNKKKKGGGEVY